MRTLIAASGGQQPCRISDGSQAREVISFADPMPVKCQSAGQVELTKTVSDSL